MANTQPEIASRGSSGGTISRPSIAERVLAVAADITTHRSYPDAGKGISHLNDPMGELNDKEEEPRPTCGCPEDNKLKHDIYEDMMREEAVRSKLNLDDRKERREVHMNILPFFRQRHREDQRYATQDRTGPPVAEGPEFTVRDGHIYYLNSATTLAEMYERQKRLRPNDYDDNEYRTMMMVERAFAEGAQIVSHVGHHKEKDGTETVRDVIILRYDPETGHGTMEIRNIALDGHFHTVEEALHIIKENMPNMNEVHPENGVGIFTDRQIDKSEVADIYKTNNSETTRCEAIENPSEIISMPAAVSEWVVTDTVQTLHDIQDRFAEDIADTLRSAGDYVHDGINKRIIIPPFLKRLLGEEESDKDHTDSHAETVTIAMIIADYPEIAELLSVEPEYQNKNKSEKKIVDIWRKHAEDLLKISHIKSEDLLHNLTEVSATIEKAKEIIFFSVDTTVAVGAAIYALKTMTLSIDSIPLDRISGKEPLSNASNSEQREGVFLRKKRIIFELLNSILEKETKSSKGIEILKFIKEEYIDKELVKRILEILAQIALSPQEQQEQILQEEDKACNAITFLKDTILEIMKKTEPALRFQNNAPESVTSNNGLTETFSIAIAFWMLFRYIRYFEILQLLRPLIKTQSTNEQILLTVNTKISEKIVQKEETPWLLLAIIRYLTMILEQNIIQSSSAQLAGQRKKKITFQSRAVIFSLTS
jgi:hypothetical protein